MVCLFIPDPLGITMDHFHVPSVHGRRYDFGSAVVGKGAAGKKEREREREDVCLSIWIVPLL